MAKKGKRNIKALIAKRAELQSLNQRPVLSIPGAPKKGVALPELVTAPETPTAALPPYHAGREIWRTVIATLVVAAALAAVIISDHQAPYLDTFGAKVYDLLRLGR